MRGQKIICVICILVTLGLLISITYEKNVPKQPIIYVYDQIATNYDGM